MSSSRYSLDIIFPEWVVRFDVGLNFRIKKNEESEIRVIPCFRGDLRGGRDTKFEVNQTNLK